MALPAFFDPIATGPRWQKLLLGIMGLAVIAGVSYYLLISPAETRVAALGGQLTLVQAELAQNRRIAADIARYRQELAQLERRMEAIRERLPNEKEMPALYRTVSDAAYQAGLGVALFEPKAPKITDYYSELPIVVAAEGGYHDVGTFLGRVASLPRVVNLTDWKLSGLTKGKGSLKADLMLATYMYRPPGSAPAPKPATAGAAPGVLPPQPPIATRPAQPEPRVTR
ncbi:MAG TPA: type 4a pilus biogenesis protein PilO [Methylomirabilota bacterium]|nr:type 4a pilus biogenesis protein PilO [Methylomirabilota bacterium]